MDEQFHEVERLLDAVIAATDVACMGPMSSRDQVRGFERIDRKVAGLQSLTIGAVARKDARDDGIVERPEAWVAKETGAGAPCPRLADDGHPGART